MYQVVSLYSGAGGLDVGFSGSNYKIVWANDFDKDACQTYKQNIGEHIRCGDINQYFKEIKTYKGETDILIGGPPCQGFSVAGKMNPHDPRSKNVWTYVDILEILQPEVFVMENVKALGKLKKWEPLRRELLMKMRGLGYSTNYIVLNASDYNVPQNRERVFFIGFKGNPRLVPDLEAMLENYKIKAPTVKESLKGLSKAGEGNNTGVCKAKITLTANPVMRKSPYAGMLFNGLGRPIRINGYCSTLPASMGGNKTPIIDERQLYDDAENWIEDYHKNLNDGSVSAEYREAPSFLRRLTVEEAALIQTFPEDYNFHGSQSSKFKQIGNAVPCNLGRQISRMISDYLNEEKANVVYLKNPQPALFEDII